MLINDPVRVPFLTLVVFRAQFICACNTNAFLALRGAEWCCVSSTCIKDVPVCAKSSIGGPGNVN